MRISSSWSVEASGADRRLQLGYLLCGDKEELSFRIEKSADEPAGGGPVDPDSRASDPFHHHTSFRKLLRRICSGPAISLRKIQSEVVASSHGLLIHQRPRRYVLQRRPGGVKDDDFIS